MQTVTYDDGFGTVFAHRHTAAELEAAWEDIEGQGNRSARERGGLCVVVDCPSRRQAVLLSAVFHRLFAIESCCHYDGRTLSMYCGEAGSGAWELHAMLRQRMIGMGFLEDEMPGPLIDESTITGRFSQPNMQNIPMQEEES